MALFAFDSQWHVREDGTIGRLDNRFFTVEFLINKQQGFGQPGIVEHTDANGIAGRVIPIIKKLDDEWHVLCSRNLRFANDYLEPLLEGARSSISNTNPYLSSGDLPVVYLEGEGFSNSARINGRLLLGVVDVTDVADYEAPKGSEWLTFTDFAEQSTDMMTQAVLFRFLQKR